jgi:zinc transport system ATP-binding protein
MEKASAISMERVSFSYNGIQALEDVSIEINDGEFIWIVGPNGGGKTTMLKLILGLLRPSQGKVLIFGRPPHKSGSIMGYMPQMVALDMKFPVNVLDVALMGRLGQNNKSLIFNKRDKSAAQNALELVGLKDHLDSRFSTLSGGQLRRLMIARALVCEPRILLLDEPTANLDAKAEKELYDLLQQLSEELTILMVSHNPSFVSESVERVICVNKKVSLHPTCEVDSDFSGEYYGGGVRMIQHNRHIDRE